MDLGLRCASRGQFHIFFKKIRIEEVDLVDFPHREAKVCLLVLAARPAVTSNSWLVAGCFDSVLAQVWVLLKDPSNGPWGVVTISFDPICYILPI